MICARPSSVEFAQLGLEASAGLQGADEMPPQDMPDGDAEFAGDGDGGSIAPAPRGHGQAPLLQRVTDLEESLALHRLFPLWT